MKVGEFSIESLSIISAIILFITKEAIESVKNWRSRKRKKDALKEIITLELQRNFGAYLYLYEVTNLLSRPSYLRDLTKIKVSEVSNNKKFIICEISNKDSTELPLLDFTEEKYQEYALDIAELDYKFHYHATCSYNWMRQLQSEKNKLLKEIIDIGDQPPSVLSEHAYRTKDIASTFFSVYRELYSYCTNGDMPGTYLPE